MGQYPVVVLFLLETGLRAGEFAALRNDNIDLENNRLNIIIDLFGQETNVDVEVFQVSKM